MMESNDGDDPQDNQLSWDDRHPVQDTGSTSDSSSSDTDDEQEGAITQRIDHLLSYVSLSNLSVS